MLKKLLYAFGLDNYTALRELLGIRRSAFVEWKNKEKKGWPLPANIQNLLSLILRQQEEIQKLRSELKAAEKATGYIGRQLG